MVGIGDSINHKSSLVVFMNLPARHFDFKCPGQVGFIWVVSGLVRCGSGKGDGLGVVVVKVMGRV